MASFFAIPRRSSSYGLLLPTDKRSRMSLQRVIIVLAVITAAFTVIGVVFYFATLQYEWINVHLVPHSHDDVGWISTPEQYYDHSVRYILDRVIHELQINANRKFIYVETYFFWKWWEEQSDVVRHVVKNLIQNGQLEMIGGGWCMSDEAVSHYQSFIDQFTWGFRRLNDTFGPIAAPNIGWQIDSFGHSKELASLMAQMGFDALFFARISEDDRAYRKKRKSMEFIWEGNKDLGSAGEIFTSIMYEHYSSPKGFDFETEPAENEVDLHKFSNRVREQAARYKTKNVLIPMGDDFRYYHAKKYFDKIDKLIKLGEEDQSYKLKIFYSTPSEYIKSLQNESVTWPRKTGDFFPYASDKHSYWTGYYTSRPTLKYFERISNNFLQVCKQLLAFSDLGNNFFYHLTKLREAVGVLQHHDAITGTAQQHVTDHYSQLLTEGIESCQIASDRSLKKLIFDEPFYQSLVYTSCLQLNVSQCNVSETSDRFVVTIYNPLNLVVNHYVRIPVGHKEFSVRTAAGEVLRSQIVNIPDSILNLPGRESFAKYELIFKALGIPGLGFKSFYVSADVKKFKKPLPNDKKIKLKFDSKKGIITEIMNEDKILSLTQEIRYYKGSHHWTGAYIFRPAEEMTHAEKDVVDWKLLNDGDLVTEYEQIFSDWSSQIVRVYNDEDFVEFEWLVGPIPTSDFIGKEVVAVYSSNIGSNKTFYTDSNGRGMIKRTRDYRDWGSELAEPISGNYYPVTAQISIKDKTTQLFVLNDRPQGGSSLRSGEIELMIHRRLCYDDGKGVDEPLNETAFGVGLISRGKHWIIFGKANDPNFPQQVKLFSQRKQSEPWLFFADAKSLPFPDWANHVTEFSGLAREMPPNVRILTFEPWGGDDILIRLEHIFENHPDASQSKPVVVNLKSLFYNFDILEGRETTLGGNKWLSDCKRFNWKAEGRDSVNDRTVNDRLTGNMTITLAPQEIKTFIIRIRPKI